MKKLLVAVLLLACLGAGGFVYYLYTMEDRKAPEIFFPDAEVTYQEGDDYKELLKGVTAADNRDGDVTASLRVENVYPNEDGETAKVVYVARDQKNNIAKANRQVKWMAAEEEEEQPEEAEAEEEQTEDAALLTQTEEPEPQEPETTVEPEVSAAEETPAEAEEALPAGAPRITLSDSRVTVKQGTSVNRIAFVKDITDDKDERDTLYGRIEITGDTLDTNTRGEYHLVYHVVDSDGNRSNEAELIIVVE